MTARRRGRPGWGHRAGIRAVGALALLASAALLPAASALAQESGDEAARRMDDRLYFVISLGRGWEPLLADFRVTLESLPESDRGPVALVRDTASERYADVRSADGTEAGTQRAFELYESLSREAVRAERRPEFARRCATIEVAWANAAEKAGDEPRALTLALSAAQRSPGFEPAYDVIARLGVKEAERAEEREDFQGALELLTKSTDLLPVNTPARAKLEQKRQQILAGTGELSFEWLGDPEVLARVRGPKTDFTAATLEFRPLEGQRAPSPKQAGRPVRVRNGRYAVTARGTGNGPATHDAGAVEVTAAGGVVTLPVAIPANMVLVPAVGTQDAFLIDRTEVTQSELASPGGGNVGGNRTAASGVAWAAAAQYVAAAGKSLPTLEQWLTAAFGDPAGRSREYPWGGAAPQPGTHFVGGSSYEGPQSVDSCPAGESAHRCLNMAGNVMEWLADRRFVGGSFRRDSFKLERQAADESLWTADYLRLPVYSYEAWDALAPAERARYLNWKANQDGSTYAQVGLRCVVPLGRPWRKR